jgi:type IV secretion system protein VirD4
MALGVFDACRGHRRRRERRSGDATVSLFDEDAHRAGVGLLGPRHGHPGGLGDPTLERLCFGVLLAVGVTVALILAAGHVSALVISGGWPRYEASDIPGIVWRAADDLSDPGRAWRPVNRGAPVPGGVAWWSSLAAIALGVAVLAVTALRACHRRRRSTASEWARGRHVRRLLVWGTGRGRLVVGTHRGRKLAVEARHSLLVLGPTQTGKTTGLALPAILEWPGPVVATSVKGDLIRDSIGWRSLLGDVHVFDPSRTTSYRPSGWSPLAECSTWAGSTRTAFDLAMAGKAAVGGGMHLADFWFGGAAKALAPYLFAAARSGRAIDDVARWIDREERDEVIGLLKSLHPDAALAHQATFKREDRARSSLFQVMQQIISVYLDPVVAASAESHEIVMDELLDGGAHTLYVTAPIHDQARFRPLFAAVIRQVLTAVFERASDQPLAAPLLLVLDEAANIAPVEDLPTVASTASAMGLQLVTVFQDVAQIKGRYGDAAGTIVNNHRAKLFLPGISDLDTLDLTSRLVGEHETERDSVTRDISGRRSNTTASHWRRLLPPELARQLKDGEGVLLYGNLPSIRVRLRPWYRDRALRRRAKHPQDQLGPREPSHGTPTAARPVTPPPASRQPPAPSRPTQVLPPNVSPLDAARERLRRAPAPGGDR